MFSRFYEENFNWQNEPDVDFDAMLKSFYPEYFIAGQLDQAKLREDLLLTDRRDEKLASRAREVFKNVYKLNYKLRPESSSFESSLVIQKIISQGYRIMAHGVEEAKGGMYNLLMMCIANKILAPSCYWGFFIPGLPNISPVSHGPYYIIYTTRARPEQDFPNFPVLEDVEKIVVPFRENCYILCEMLDKMMLDGLCSAKECEIFLEKLIDYREFARYLNHNEPLYPLRRSQRMLGR